MNAKFMQHSEQRVDAMWQNVFESNDQNQRLRLRLLGKNQAIETESDASVRLIVVSCL